MCKRRELLADLAAYYENPHKIGRRETRAGCLGWLHCRQINEFIGHSTAHVRMLVQKELR